MPHVEAGQTDPLATTGLLTRPSTCGHPHGGESGFPGFEALNWYAFVAPRRTPAPLLDAGTGNRQGAERPRGEREALNKHASAPQPTTRAELTAFMKRNRPSGRHHQRRKVPLIDRRWASAGAGWCAAPLRAWPVAMRPLVGL